MPAGPLLLRPGGGLTPHLTLASQAPEAADERAGGEFLPLISTSILDSCVVQTLLPHQGRMALAIWLVGVREMLCL